jgi:hypothetical protein
MGRWKPSDVADLPGRQVAAANLRLLPPEAGCDQRQTSKVSGLL